MTSDTLQPMDLGEIYGRAISLIRRTPALTLIIFLLILGAAILYGSVYKQYLGVQADLYASGGMGPGADPQAQQEAMKASMGVMIPFASVLVLFFFVVTYTQVAATIGGWDALNDRPVGVGDVLGRAFRRPFWVSLLQTIIFMMVMVAAGIVVGIVSFALSGGHMEMIGIFFAILFTIVCAYPLVATSFRIHKVAIESRGPWQGMIASIALVKGSFWRTFGVLFLLGVAMFAISLITGYAMGSVQMPGNANVEAGDTAAMAAMMQKAKDAYTWPVIIVNSVQLALSFTFMYYLLTPLYADLRARRGEFLPAENEEGYDAEDYNGSGEDHGGEDRSWEESR